MADSVPTPPVAPRLPHERTPHDDTFVDPYEWLRDKESPETVAYLEAENDYVQARTGHLESLRQQIFDEIKGRTQETDLSVPVRIRGHWYYGRTVEGKQYGLSCRRPVRDPESWMPPVTKWKLVPPCMVMGSRGWCVSTNTGTW